MGIILDKTKPVDVICQMNRDGSIIPIKIRLADEDGQEQTYVIRGYRELSNKGDYVMPNGYSASANMYKNFECRIISFGRELCIHMFFNSKDNTWYMISVR